VWPASSDRLGLDVDRLIVDPVNGLEEVDEGSNCPPRGWDASVAAVA
jgi:hypothetical protein